MLQEDKPKEEVTKKSPKSELEDSPEIIVREELRGEVEKDMREISVYKTPATVVEDEEEEYIRETSSEEEVAEAYQDYFAVHNDIVQLSPDFLTFEEE